MPLFKNATTEIIDSANNVIDNIVTNKEERDTLKIQMNGLINEHVTNRHQADMNSDSWLSKNIRPLTLAFLLLLMLLSTIPALRMPEKYIMILEDWGGLAIMFYFGSRGLEKTAKVTGGLFNRKK